jgi:N-acetylglucosamine kinase-like BadF-type ATPase
MPLFIGIEGVGMRKCVAVASNEKGQILGSSKIDSGISLHATRRDNLQSHLRRLIKEVAESVGRRLSELSDAVVCIGLRGVTFQYDAEVDLPREFEDLQLTFRKLICTGDAEIVFASHTQAAVGGAIICHMGSTAYVVRGSDREDRFRVGGWGPAIGDEGSGYWIGRSALRAVGEAFERRDDSVSVLWDEINQWLTDPDQDIPSWRFASKTWTRLLTDYTLRQIEEVRPAIFVFAHEVSRESIADWREVASGLVIPVVRAAEKGDSTAKRLLSQAADHLRQQYVLAYKMSGLQEESLPLVLYGGVLTHSSYFREMVIEGLEEHCKKVQIVTSYDTETMRPACGALLFALGDSTTSHLKLPAPEVIESLRNDLAVTRPDINLIND